MVKAGPVAVGGLIGVVLCVWTVSGRHVTAGQRTTDLASLRALIEAGRYVEAEEAGLKLVAAIDAGGGAAATPGRETSPDAPAAAGASATAGGPVEVAEALDLVLEARGLGRRLTQPRSVQIGERALAIKEAAYGADDVRVTATLMLLGLARSAHRDAEGGRTAAARALAIRERALGPDHLDVAAALNALASVERTAGRFDQSAVVARRALDLARRVERPAGRETAAALNTLGHFEKHQGRSDLAVPLFEEALAIDERRYGPDHPALVSRLQPLADAYWDTGDVDKTRSARERMIRLLSTPGSEYRLAFELLLLSSWFTNVGDYSSSLSVAERAVQIAERATGPTSPLSAAALDQLALAQTRLNDHAAATAIRQRTIAVWTAAQGESSVHTANAWKALAESYEEAGRIEDGLDAIDRALAVPALTKEPMAYPRALQAKARLLMARGRLADARTVLEQARRLGESSGTYSTIVTDLAMTYRLLARVEHRDGQPARAVPFYREGLRLFEATLGAAHPTVATWRTELAAVLAETGELAEARQALKSGEEQSLDHLRLVARTLTDRAALNFAASRLSGIDLGVTLAADRRVRVRADIETAWDMVIHGRTVVLDEMAARQRAVTEEAGNTALHDRWTTLNRTRARLANLIIRGPADQPADVYQALVERTRADRDRAERDLAQASVAFRHEQQRSRAGLREVLATLPPDAVVISYVRYTPQPVATPVPAPATRAEARAPTSAGYAAFIARAGRPVAIVPLGSAERIEAAIDTWRARIRDELSSAGLASRRTETAYRAAGAALRSLIWDPVHARLAALTPSSRPSTMFIVPDGALHLVDLATLPTGRTGYLVDAPFVLHYLLAERDLLLQPSATQSDTLLALGAPNFDKADRNVVAPPTWTIAGKERASDTSVARSATTASVCDASFATRFDPLPSTRDEVLRIAELWQRGIAAASRSERESTASRAAGGKDAAAARARDGQAAVDERQSREPQPAGTVAPDAGSPDARGTAGPSSYRTFSAVVLGGVRATETAFKSLARGRRVLHIATHGFFLDRFCAMTSPIAAAGDRGSSSSGQRVLEENPLLRSGLVLAGANLRAEGDGGGAIADDDDGILTAEEIAGLDLSEAQWAVLSACDTGRGDWQAGEGVLGLRRAFQVAGARTVILSLWPVLDTVTSTWMTALYRDKFVGGQTTAAAVRAANRTLLAERRAKGESTHPLYWSGFIATGDWR